MLLAGDLNNYLCLAKAQVCLYSGLAASFVSADLVAEVTEMS